MSRWTIPWACGASSGSAICMPRSSTARPADRMMRWVLQACSALSAVTLLRSVSAALWRASSGPRLGVPLGVVGASLLACPMRICLNPRFFGESHRCCATNLLSHCWACWQCRGEGRRTDSSAKAVGFASSPGCACRHFSMPRVGMVPRRTRWSCDSGQVANRSSYFSSTVIVGLVLVLSKNTSLFPEIMIAVVLLPTFPVPFDAKE